MWHCFSLLFAAPEASAGSSLLVTSVFLCRVVLNCTCLGNAWLLCFFHLPVALLMYILLQFYVSKDICAVVGLEKPLSCGLREETALTNCSFYWAPVLCITSLGYFPGCVLCKCPHALTERGLMNSFSAKQQFTECVCICMKHTRGIFITWKKLQRVLNVL